MARYRRAVRALRAAGLERPIHAIAGSLYAVSTEQPVFHLTFDDGPHPEVTLPVLDALDEYDAKATFFVLTGLSEKHPELVKETLRRGHTIALHTRTHPRLSDLSWRQLIDEIRYAKRDLEAVIDSPVKWFRPPYGAEGMRSIPIVKTSGMKTVVWSADTHDWKGLTETGALKNVSKNLTPGGIALLHDIPAGGSVGEDAGKGFISKEQLTRILLDELKRLGLRPVSLDALLDSGAPLRRAKLA